MMKTITIMNATLSRLILIMLGIICMSACSSDDNPSGGDVDFIVPENIINNGVVVAKSGGEAAPFNIKASSAPIAEISATWCKAVIEPTSSATIFRCTVSADANPDAADREAKLTIKQGAHSVEVPVRQTAADAVIVENTLIDNVPAAGGAIQVKLKANGDVTCTVNDSWITSSRAAMKDMAFDFTVSENRATVERTGSITFTLGDIVETVTVKQLAGAGAATGDITSSDPREVAAALGLGWNLGNQFDAHNSGVASETAWGNPRASQKLFDAVAASGIRTVRIPVTWLGQFGSAPDYAIKKDYLDRVAEVVGYAENAGLNAIINIHHDGADGAHWLDIKGAANDAAKNAEVKKQITAIWTQIAERFKDKGPWLIFESFNEIHDGGWGWGANRNDGGKQYRTLNEWNQTFVDAVRATGGNNATRYVAVPGYVTNPELTMENLVLPTDRAQKTIVAVHFYDPNEYTLNAKFSEWGHTGKDKESWGDEQNVRDVFSKLKAKYVDNGIPVYIGEMGNVNRSTDRARKFRLYYMEYVAKAACDNGLAPIIWDNGAQSAGRECSGLFNRTTGNFYDDGGDVISVMVKALTTDSPDYTLDTVYNSAPK